LKNKKLILVKKYLKKYYEPFKRLKDSIVFKKQNFNLKSSSEVFVDIYKDDFWNSKESKSGVGSTFDATTIIREQLPRIIEDFSITSMLDVPCGDFNWMKEVPKKCTYTGGDIVAEVVKRNQELYATDTVQFQQIDISSNLLPKVDLIFCRDCLQHISDDKVKKALKNFKDSGSKYLLVTSYPMTWRNYDIYDGDYRPLNLLIKPYFLSNYLLKIQEAWKVEGVEIDKTMYLFELRTMTIF
jgi:SAM-dependent methyltransferase